PWDDGEGDDARTLHFHALDQVDLAAADQGPAQGPENASVHARAILDRPEFQQPPPRKARPEEKPKTEESAWNRFWRRVGEWLAELFRPRREAPPPELDLVPGGGQVVANALAVVLLAGVLVALGLLVLWRCRRSRG